MKKTDNDNLTLALPLVAISLLIAATFGCDNHYTAFEQSKNQQFWRLFTAHFSHYDLPHLAGNLTALLLLLYLFPQQKHIFTTAVLFTITAVTILAYQQQIERFMGLSALLYTIPGTAFIDRLMNKKSSEAAFIALILTAYLMLLAPSADSIRPAWTAAHLLGFIAGNLSFMIFRKKPLFLSKAKK